MKAKSTTPAILCALVASVASLSTGALASDPVESSLDNAFANLEETVLGKFNLNIRTRYEYFRTPAMQRKGFSQRLRYGYTTPSFEGFNAMIEGETLYAFNGSDEIHPLDQAGRGTELNQLWIQYSNTDYGSVKLGRQIYFLDDHRFVGHVGWRQNIQTFDAVTARFTGVDNFALNAFYLDRVKRVDSSGADMDSYGINASYQFAPAFKLTGFAYRFDFDRFAAWSNDTVGVRLTGTADLAESKLNYAFSYAHQTDNSGSGNRDFSLDYFAGDIGVTFFGLTLGGGFELLEGDGAEGFRTPLATVHAFSGYADKFLPIAGFPQGLDDRYVYVGYRLPVGNGIPLRAAYHWFSPENGPGGYGTEFDLMASYVINKYFNVIAKYGSYRPDSDAVGVGIGKKDMFTFELNFTY